MRLLLDTHIFLWWLADDAQLTAPVRTMVNSMEEVFVSSASLWEAAIKINLGKLKANLNELHDAIHASGFTELPLIGQHVLQLSQLADHHKDPFDRILLAQALSEPLHFMTADKTLKQYSELVILV